MTRTRTIGATSAAAILAAAIAIAGFLWLRPAPSTATPSARPVATGRGPARNIARYQDRDRHPRLWRAQCFATESCRDVRHGDLDRSRRLNHRTRQTALCAGWATGDPVLRIGPAAPHPALRYEHTIANLGRTRTRANGARSGKPGTRPRPGTARGCRNPHHRFQCQARRRPLDRAHNGPIHRAGRSRGRRPKPSLVV
jgi:hypothetical protein